MRLTENLSFFYKILFIEIGILFFVCAVFYSQFGNARSNLINKTIAASELISNEASQFLVHTENPTSNDFYASLRSKYGQEGIFKSFNVVPSSFEVLFTKEGRKGQEARNLYSDRGYGVRETGGILSVSVPFLMGADGDPYGVVTVNSSRVLVMKKVLLDNFLLYLALFVVLNNQVFILRYLASRKRKEIIDKNYAKPYMKQRSIGALKVMRQVLEEIIEDHPKEQREKDKTAKTSETEKKTGSKKIISFSGFLSKNNR